MKIIEQALDGLPEGPYITPDRHYALPPRHELATSMEAMVGGGCIADLIATLAMLDPVLGRIDR